MTDGPESQPTSKMPERVLIVDDDRNVLDAYRRRLRRALEVETCDDPIEALTKIQSATEYAVVISDFMMPKMNGIQLLKKCKEYSPHSVRMMLTGVGDFSTSVEAVNSGSVFRFLIKPCAPETLARALVDGIRHYRLVMSQDNLLRNTLRESIRLVNEVAMLVEPDTFTRIQRLSPAVAAVAKEVEPEHVSEIEIAWLLSAVGALSIPAELMRRRYSGETLGEHETRALSRIASISASIAERIPNMELVSAMIGSGAGQKNRPGALVSAETVPRGGAILAVFEAYAATEAQGIPETERIDVLRASKQKFDAVVFKALEHYLDAQRDAPELFPTPVPVEELQPGDVLGSDVRTAEGEILAKTGTELTFILRERIRNFSAFVRIDEPITVLRHDVVVELDEPGD